MVLTIIYVESNAQIQSVRSKNPRQAVAIYSDTALTSDLRIVRRPYRFTDNLFWGLNLSTNRIISEENDKGFLSMISPGAELFIGKYFSPWISINANIDYFYLQNKIPFINYDYSFHTIGLSVEGQLCTNRLFTRYKDTEKWLFYLLGDIGYNYSVSSNLDSPIKDIVDTHSHFSPFFKTGVMVEKRISEGSSLTLQAKWATTTQSICGLPYTHRDKMVEFSIGYLYRLPNHYASRAFQNCRGNEIYYFQKLEEQLIKDHQYQQKLYKKGKAEAPLMAAEQDSILIFPCGYPYLTKRQEAKLDKVAALLSANKQLMLVIDLYPIVSDDPKMTPSQSVQQTEVAIRTYFTKHKKHPISDNRLHFLPHPDSQSPYANQSIWIHGAIIHYQQI